MHRSAYSAAAENKRDFMQTEYEIDR